MNGCSRQTPYEPRLISPGAYWNSVVIGSRSSSHYVSASPLPTALLEAIADVARAQGLAPEWLNPGPTHQLRFGLPDGFRERTSKQHFGALVVHIASRFDHICFKLRAAADEDKKS